MHAILLAIALAQPISYQQRTFDRAASESGGELTGAESSCVESTLPIFWPSENGADFLRVKYARHNSDRSQVCLTYYVERSMPTADVVTLPEEPSALLFSVDGLTAYYREKLQTQCVPRGQAVSIVNCLSAYTTVPGLVTEFDLDRTSTSELPSLLYLWQSVTGQPAQWAALRAVGVARPVQTETPPPPEVP